MTLRPMVWAMIPPFLLGAIVSLLALTSAGATPPAPLISTVAGGGPNGIQARSAAINVSDIALDQSGNIYFASSREYRLFKIEPSGLLTVVAGTGIQESLGDGAPAGVASLFLPGSIATTATGDLIFHEGGEYSFCCEPYPVLTHGSLRIRRIDAASGLVSTVTALGNPADLLVTGAGGLFAAWWYYPPSSDYVTPGKVSRIDLITGTATLVAGSGAWVGGPLDDAMPATSVSLLSSFLRLAEGPGGSLLISDPEHSRIRRVDLSTGLIDSYAGNGTPGYSGDGGPALEASLVPGAIAADGAGNLFLFTDGRIRRIDATTRTITTVVGDGTWGSTGDGGPAAEARIEPGAGLAVSANGDLYIGSRYQVRKVSTATGLIDTVAGDPNLDYYGDSGPATSARIERPVDVALSRTGDLYIADAARTVIRKVDSATGRISTLPIGGYTELSGIAVHPDGDIYFVKHGGFNENGPFGWNIVSRIDPVTGIITDVAGVYYPGYSGDGGPASNAALYLPEALAIDTTGNVFIADTGNGRIRRIDAATGMIRTVAGGGSLSSVGDGGPATQASLVKPTGVAVDSQGHLFIAESGRNRIRRVDGATGVIETVAGSGEAGYSGDGGPATLAAITAKRVALDARGNFFISGGERIRSVDTATGIITTVAGDGAFGFYGDGGPADLAALGGPDGLLVDGTGRLLIAAAAAGRVRQVLLPVEPPEIVVTASPAILWPPAHQMVDVEITVTQVRGDRSARITLKSVVSDEPDDAVGVGDGRTMNDIQDAAIGELDDRVRLRAERDSHGVGRSYTVTYRAEDTCGHAAEGSTVVFVPRDQSGGVGPDPLALTLTETSSGTLVEWPLVPGALSYDVVRGLIPDLHETIDAIDLGRVTCIEAQSPDGSTAAGHEDPSVPEAGSAFFYLVAYNDGASGLSSSLGAADAPKPRVAEPGSGCR